MTPNPYLWVIPILPLAGAAMDTVGDPGLGWTLALFYSVAGIAALLAFHRRG